MSDGAIAPQSTMMNGARARGPRRTISAATSSLPVPLSPSIRTTASLAETFSRIANRRCITGARPKSSPKETCSRMSTWVAAGSSRKTSDESPSSMVQSVGRSASRTTTPLMVVPLVEPLSTMRHERSARSIEQWNRDTRGSETTTSFLGWEPTLKRSPSRTTVRWTTLPASRAIAISTRGAGTRARCAGTVGSGTRLFMGSPCENTP